MNIISKPRRSGRTTELIKIAHHTQSTMLVADKQRKRNVVQMAKDLGVVIEVLTVEEYLNPSTQVQPLMTYNTWRTPISLVIDDLDFVLQSLFKGYILAVTTLSDRQIIEL